ncbi:MULTISPECIES: MauE/DoxX family redox-associated membrane protein [unclassified Kaistella]|uniref:MauE/DoxX family redox-associated membrane protein n=1 Tax=unclassified Kaistella TaxID=2762626 RepID=UPI002732F151|nr:MULTISPECIES: MauE/DoxX family redox-associated membrane protein [unclassified Kaistella]MDP2452503.1 hypothetical protein [Kaistella sp. SH11-4b]MDP2455411.1 hypothetical protein [Kaistella sp. SH40-3]MDP2458315.1 hypothetical protein [Kaistella sp. SH19-2b]
MNLRAICKVAVTVVSYFFMVLLVYAAVSKMRDFENFQVQLAQSPLLSAYSGFISYGVIALELVIAGVLAFPQVRRVGLYASFGLMVAFTVYIYLILNYSDFVPCSCGGILEKLGWREHLIFNGVCVVLALTTSVFMGKERAHGWSRIAAAALIAVFSAGSMVALFLSSEYIMKKENNFTRRFPHHPIIEEKSLDLKVNSYYFAGISGNTIYLGNSSTPFRIIRMDYSLQKSDTLDLVPATNHRFRSLIYTVQNGMLYAHDGAVPVIYSSPVDSLAKPLREISSKDIYFDQMAVVSPSQFLLRVKDAESERTSIGCITVGEPAAIRVHSTLLTTKADGGFDADGQLVYDKETGIPFYLFYYRNQILQFNKYGQLKGQMKTIDTVAEARLKVLTLPAGRKKLAEPPLLVNRNMTVHGGLIFNESGLMGRHESRTQWKKNAVVDIYKTSPAGYWGSMYVQHRGKHRLSRMLVTDTYFFVLSGDEMVRYRFAQTVTEQFIKRGSRKPFSE